MKIIFVTKGYHSAAGGAESAARDWYVRISESVDAALLTDKPSMIGKAIQSSPFSFVVAANPLTFISYAISISRKLKRMCNEEKPDLIHIHSYSGYIVIPPTKIPTLVTFHDEPFLKIYDPISPAPIRYLLQYLRLSQDFMRSLILSRNPYVQATGSTTANLIESKYPNVRTRVIPNPFYTRTNKAPTKTREELFVDLGISKTDKVVLTVGHIISRKAVHKILDAAILLANSNIHFVVIGKTPNFISREYFRAVSNRAKSHRISNFHMLGFVENDELHNFYSHSDVYLSASQSEACNLALIEAASYHLPIITTRVGAALDLFLGEASFLERNCSGADIVNTVSRDINNPRKEYEKIQDATWNRTMGALLKFYSDIVNSEI